MGNVWMKAEKNKVFRRLTETERAEVLNETYRAVYAGLPEEEKQGIQKMIRGLLVKNGTQQSGVIKGLGEKSLLELIGNLGILFAGMSDEALATVKDIRKIRRRMEAEYE